MCGPSSAHTDQDSDARDRQPPGRGRHAAGQDLRWVLGSRRLLTRAEIEELRHSPSARSAHAARLDTLLSEADAAVDNLTPRIAAVDLIGSDAEVPDLLTALRADWAKATAQHYLVKQELQEDPWLVRFRT